MSTLSDDDAKNVARYIQSMHGVQSAIATEIEKCGLEQAGASPKHLRVGINSAMVNDHAVAELLIAKGVFTKSEYLEQVDKSAALELDSMRGRVIASCGLPEGTQFG